MVTCFWEAHFLYRPWNLRQQVSPKCLSRYLACWKTYLFCVLYRQFGTSWGVETTLKLLLIQPISHCIYCSWSFCSTKKNYSGMPAVLHNVMFTELRGLGGGNCKRQPSNLRGDKRGVGWEKGLLRFQRGDYSGKLTEIPICTKNGENLQWTHL